MEIQKFSNDRWGEQAVRKLASHDIDQAYEFSGIGSDLQLLVSVLTLAMGKVLTFRRVIQFIKLLTAADFNRWRRSLDQVPVDSASIET